RVAARRRLPPRRSAPPRLPRRPRAPRRRAPPNRRARLRKRRRARRARLPPTSRRADRSPSRMSERRILLKLSGELLCGPGGFGVEPDATWELAQRIRKGLESSQTEVALVIGGGNFLRGAKLS